MATNINPVQQSQAQDLHTRWSAMALAADGHLRFSYDDADSSFSLGYNMFWDLLLGTGLLNSSVIGAQTSFIAKQVQTYGVPTDSTNTSIASASECRNAECSHVAA